VILINQTLEVIDLSCLFTSKQNKNELVLGYFKLFFM